MAESSAFANVTITVLDVNDNSPVFNQSSYTTTLPYDQLEEWSFQVTATDRDTRSSAIISYSITDGDPGGVFEIDVENGIICVVEPFNEEEFQNFTLTVQAEDNGSPILSDKTTVMVDVTRSTGDSAATLHSKKLFMHSLLAVLTLLASAIL